MIINRNKTSPRGQLVRLFLAIGILSGLMLSGLPAHAQVQRKPKGPTPPSYDEVMQRALAEKKAASNAPVVAPVTPPVAPSLPVITTPLPAAKTAPPAATLTPELKSASPSVVPATAPSVQPVEIAPKPPPPVITAPAGAVVTPTTSAGIRPESQLPVAAPAVVKVESSYPPPKTVPPAVKPTKGPKFSELPPDLRPRSETDQSPASGTNGLLPSISPNDSTSAMAALDDKHGLAIGDVLSFRIVEDEEDPKPMIVTDSGELEVPYIGRFVAVGKTCKELAQALKAELEKEYYFQATVIIAVDQMTKSRGKVYLVGAVRVPGPQEIPSDEVLTVSKAILRAGGFTDFADKKSVKVTRKTGAGGQDQSFAVNVEVILEKGKSEADLPLLPGDLIFVPERLIRF